MKPLLSLLVLPVLALASGTSAAGAAHSLTNDSWWGVVILCGIVALAIVARKSKALALFCLTAAIVLASGTSAAGVYCGGQCDWGGPIDSAGAAQATLLGISIFIFLARVW